MYDSPFVITNLQQKNTDCQQHQINHIPVAKFIISEELYQDNRNTRYYRSQTRTVNAYANYIFRKHTCIFSWYFLASTYFQ
jgi:hypothetical protein